MHIYPESKHISELSMFSKLINSFRQQDNKLINFLGKSLALQSLGKFALNLDKHTQHMERINNGLTLQYKIQTKDTNYFDILERNKNTFCLSNKKTRGNYNTNVRANRYGINPLIFANCANYVRRKVYTDCVNVVKSKTLELVRVDVDSISILIKHVLASTSEVSQIFRNTNNFLQYKLEHSNLIRIASYTKRCYTLESDEVRLIRACGLSLSYEQRFEKINFDLMFKCFLENVLSKGFDYFSKNNPPCGIPTELLEFENEFGGKYQFIRCLPYGTFSN